LALVVVEEAEKWVLLDHRFLQQQQMDSIHTPNDVFSAAAGPSVVVALR
jgi:hypothetical protein